MIGLPAALIILLLVFGAVVAGLVPVLMGLLSIVIAVALTALVGQAFEVSFFVVNMISAMGLALGIDYALFILSRYREERVRGLEKIEAIVASGATASRAVLFSGIAFVLAMFGMLLVPDTILRSLALGAILVGIVSVLAALTLLPAVLGLLGDRVNALRIPVIGRRAISSAGSESRFWSALVGGVMRRPLVSLLGATALLLVAAAPVLAIDTGFSGLSTLPDRFPSKQGFVALNRDFPGIGVDPAQIVVQGDVSTAPVRSAIERLRSSLDDQGTFGTATQTESESGDLVLISVPVAGDADGAEATSAIRHLRTDLIPDAFGDVDAVVLVGGTSAENADYFDLVGGWLPIVFAFVLGLSFILLTVAFRSIVIPAVAIALNLLAVEPPMDCSCSSSRRASEMSSSGSSRSIRSRPGCPFSSSLSSSASRWTTRCSCSAGSRSATRRPEILQAPSPLASAPPRGSSPAPRSSSSLSSPGSRRATWSCSNRWASGSLWPS